jgi:hypothetical protein
MQNKYQFKSIANMNLYRIMKLKINDYHMIQLSGMVSMGIECLFPKN